MSVLTPMRFCVEPGCSTRVAYGRCAHHQRSRLISRPTRQARGYGKEWQRFRGITFPDLLRKAGIPDACGSRLAPSPSPYSRCAAAGVVNMDNSLELDHEPPLRDHERGDVGAVCDAQRVAFLCRSCHQAKTSMQQRGAHG